MTYLRYSIDSNQALVICTLLNYERCTEEQGGPFVSVYHAQQGGQAHLVRVLRVHGALVWSHLHLVTPAYTPDHHLQTIILTACT